MKNDKIVKSGYCSRLP